MTAGSIHWFTALAPYHYTTKDGSWNNAGDLAGGDAPRRSIFWGCPSWPIPRSADGSLQSWKIGLGMSRYPLLPHGDLDYLVSRVWKYVAYDRITNVSTRLMITDASDFQLWLSSGNSKLNGIELSRHRGFANGLYYDLHVAGEQDPARALISVVNPGLQP